MAISSSTRKAGPYLGNDATTVFPFDFKVFEAADLMVVETDNLLIERTLELGPDYSVELHPNQDEDAGGSVILAAALPDDYLLTIGSNLPLTQPLELTNAGGFYPRVINAAFDRITIIAQQLLEQLGRTLKLPFSTNFADATLPIPVANGLIGFNSAADGFTVVDPANLVSVAGYADARVEQFDGDGVTTDFVIEFNPGVLANLDVSISGVVQLAGVDFTWSGTTVIFTTAPFNGAVIQIRYARPIAPVPNFDATVEAANAALAFEAALSGDESASLSNTTASGADAVTRDLLSVSRDVTSALGYESITAAAASFGTDTPPLVEGAVYIPNGVYPEDFVTGQATRFVGQSRGGAVIQSQSGGVAAVLDARRTRGSGATNTWGAMQVEHLTVDGNGQAREGVCLYGGGGSVRNTTIENCDAVGLRLQYVLKTVLDTVTVQNNSGNGIEIDVDNDVHPGDVNTSINTLAVWSQFNDGYGVKLTQGHYCNLSGVTTQGNTLGGFHFDGSGSSVNATVTLTGCASELDNGSAFYGKALRDFLINPFFLLANPASNSFVFDNCTGTVIGLTDTTVHTGGTYTVSILNGSLGGITFIGGNITMDPAQMKFCTFLNCVVNGNLVSSVGRLDITDASDAQSFYLDTTPLGGDYSGLGVYDATGLRIAAFRRFNGGVVLSSGGGIDAAALNNGDFIGYVGTTTLTFQAKGTDGVVRTGTVTLAP